ncbi:SAM-dependent methyltransferase [Amphritea sp. HPY]|uniref:SAM-dependent methyltransferase n=1 Tax=Amphritea sp. HPY TaxID=3421652 RepID=UPI003D7CA945
MYKDRVKWDRRYSDKTIQLPSPVSFLLDNSSILNPGTVLDLACGDGAAALYLAKESRFTVTAADISEQGLKRLTAFAAQQGVNIRTVCVDLDDSDAVAELGQYDNIVISLFKPSSEQFLRVVSLLKPAGKLMLSTFNQQHHEDTGFPLKYCLSDNEFSIVPSGLRLLEHHCNPDLAIDSYVFVAQG